MPRTVLITRVVTIAIAAVLISCGSDASTAPGANIAGNWSGALTNSVVGDGSLTLTIVQSADSLSGTWATTFPTLVNNSSGSVAGSIHGTQITAKLASDNRSICSTEITATLNGVTISGTGKTYSCVSTWSNTFIISKRQ